MAHHFETAAVEAGRDHGRGRLNARRRELVLIAVGIVVGIQLEGTVDVMHTGGLLDS